METKHELDIKELNDRLAKQHSDMLKTIIDLRNKVRVTLTSAVRRMESVPWEELAELAATESSGQAVRRRLIAAVKGDA